MQKPPLDPDVADTAPSDSLLTTYDEEHVMTYLRPLDADAEGADWREVARVVLHLDPAHETGRARRAFDGHLSRAKWMTEQGYGTFYVVARRRRAQKPPTWAAVLSHLLVALHHQANLARWPKPTRLLPFACTEDVRVDSLRLLQAVHSSRHFRGRYMPPPIPRCSSGA